MHELAVASGFSAAYRLGANYPFSKEEGCGRLFKLYLAASHGMRAVCLTGRAYLTTAEGRPERIIRLKIQSNIRHGYNVDMQPYNSRLLGRRPGRPFDAL